MYQIYEQMLSHITNVRYEGFVLSRSKQMTKKQNFNQVAEVFRLLFMCYAVLQKPCCMTVSHMQLISWRNLDINVFKKLKIDHSIGLLGSWLGYLSFLNIHSSIPGIKMEKKHKHLFTLLE